MGARTSRLHDCVEYVVHMSYEKLRRNNERITTYYINNRLAKEVWCDLSKKFPSMRFNKVDVQHTPSPNMVPVVVSMEQVGAGYVDTFCSEIIRSIGAQFPHWLTPTGWTVSVQKRGQLLKTFNI